MYSLEGVFLKTHRLSSLKLSSVLILVAILIITLLFSACEKNTNSNSVLCNLDDCSLYPKVVEEILPTFHIEQSEIKPYYILNEDGIVEAFDTQAMGAIETGIAKYWYPQYLATVIIAIDRDQTHAVVKEWKDLLISQQEVGLFNTPGNIQMVTAAMSYGLEGEGYSLTKAIELLASLHENNCLKINSFESPMIICYDYQAATLIKNGRNMEIIIPLEGTLTYEKGLLSNESLVFEKNIDELLIQNKFRLLNGQADYSIYPDKLSYRPAVRVVDYNHFAQATRDISPLMERRVLKGKRFMSVDFREHLIVALIYMSIVTLWASWVLRRSMQKGISYAAFFTGVILNGWALVRLIKYQVVVNGTLSRYLWYSYYIFQLSLPLVILWMAWAIDKPKKETFPPKWWRSLAILILGLIILVFTNDLHGLVFQLDLTRPDWGINYTYGMGYYLILFVSMMNITIAFIILLIKSIKSPRIKAFIFPLGTFILFGFYNYKYIIRDPFIYETDLTVVTGIFAMLMFETCIRSGLIPVNTKYIQIFTRSPLKIQILNKEKEVAMASASAEPINKDIIEKVIATSPFPVLQEDESLLYANPIPGGYALWIEDVSKIQELQRDIKKSTKNLKEANAMLAKEEKIKRLINERNVKKQLMEQLEGEIAENLKKLSTMIEKLEHSYNHLIETTRIALLLCYIKRRCNLFFKEKEVHSIEINELVLYMDELSDLAKRSNVNIVTVNLIKGNLTIRHATLFYDFFYSVIDLSVTKSCPYIIANMEAEEEWITLRILPSENIGELETNSKFKNSIEAEKGKIARKDIEDTIGISISFPKGGVEIE